MGGVNPYIQKVRAARADRPFTLTLVDEETGTRTDVRVDPATFPLGHLGETGSVLDIATEAGVEINHSCGGVCACSTCHVYVTRGLASCSKATEDEEDMLDEAPALTPESRLACQCVPDGSADVEVVIPKWNRNQVKEGHH
ncbi:MAG: 2Fe-2S iron-sulfur cluster binding domain-containing protein [Gemmataceae bacterium]|nr:2Fe-2S iron-sulfur cluster binding domain-containing protein [Gemmataceae bacterium]